MSVQTTISMIVLQKEFVSTSLEHICVNAELATLIHSCMTKGEVEESVQVYLNLNTD